MEKFFPTINSLLHSIFTLVIIFHPNQWICFNVFELQCASFKCGLFELVFD